MPKATVEVVRCARDARGCVFEPIGAELLCDQKNAHVAVTKPGAIRGNHYHQHSSETAVVMGPALVRFREEGELRDCVLAENEIRRFTIPAGVSHSFQNTGTKPMVLVAFSTTEFDASHPDVIRDQLI